MFSNLFSRYALLNRRFLWLLLVVNALGTVYGYYWYKGQLEATVDAGNPLWQLVFVPDSPTASLFFTLSLLYLLFPPVDQGRLGKTVRVLIEGLGTVTSVKYGIWATTMILAGAARGDMLEPAHFMLMASHLGMALEALLYVRFMAVGKIAALAAAGWLLLNDYCDYHYGIYPYLPSTLENDVPAVRTFTIGLSIFSLLAVWLAQTIGRRRQGR
ncbi:MULTISPECIES: DUF1405 domain-containing protein [unclassified Paenibacillus]|uniref:DUF1405 domain-containing protein n=1 Tax=unclassified Paenibacillus TaxID=185978 RepID=UPI000953BDA9|nr:MULTISPECIES: DUF1405 domain-containing protein [unclassified Paenibacillus]SIQ46569.1 Uncharacterized membrane protein YpjA [Paenibacillus sp. RU4X]SIQ68497.1 Uncharacterized membrane protein YpjA [Paenibacillus sp. RU4T]